MSSTIAQTLHSLSTSSRSSTLSKSTLGTEGFSTSLLVVSYIISSSNDLVTRATQTPIRPTKTNFGSPAAIALSIGLPVGLFCFGLVVLLCYFYMQWFKSQKGSQDYEKCFHPQDIIEPSDDYMSSRIQYKISRLIQPQHILTPKVPLYKDSIGTASSLNIKEDVDTYLYTRPPNIYHIDSRMTSTNDLTNSGKKTNIVSQVISRSTDVHEYGVAEERKWTYNSPLSKWFLRGSTYLDDTVTFPISIKTPTFQLKRLKVLTKIQKDYNDLEGSLALERLPNSLSHEGGVDHETSIRTLGGFDDRSKEKEEASLCGSLQCGSKAPFKRVTSTPDIDTSRREKKTRKGKSKSLVKHLKKITAVKPLPQIPNSCNLNDLIKGERIYEVVTSYAAQLPDEINVDEGDCVKILATHSDGWCLVEKCKEADEGLGEMRGIYNDDPEKVDSSTGKTYLNSFRGIIPGSSLQKEK